MDGTMLLRRYGPALALAGTVGLLGATLRPHYDPAGLAEAEARLLSTVRVRRTHRFVQAGPHQIHTLIAGDGPPLVMLHGHGGGVGVWRAVLDGLAAHFRVYALDWLGWGRSARPRFAGSTPDEARAWWLDSLEAWRQAMGLGDFTLLGHSLGGWLAAEYALAHPERLRHLILENPAGLTDAVPPQKGLFYVVSPQRVVQAIGPLGLRLVEYGCAEEAAACEAGAETLLSYYYQLSVAPLSGQLAFERILTPTQWHLPLLPRAEGLTVPTTIVWGLNDDLLRIHDAHLLQMRLPQSRMVVLPQAFHSPHLEEPTRLVQVVAATLDPAYSTQEPALARTG